MDQRTIIIRTQVKGKRRFVKVDDISVENYLKAVGEVFNIPRNTNLTMKMTDHTHTPIQKEDFENILQIYNNGDFCVHIEYQVDCSMAPQNIQMEVSQILFSL